jgi:hypothetical protein
MAQGDRVFGIEPGFLNSLTQFAKGYESCLGNWHEPEEFCGNYS